MEESEVAIWNEITTDFDPEEETANFGTRHAHEEDGNIYEVVTLATIESSGATVQKNPRVLGEASSDHVVLSIDTCLSIFSPTCSEVTPLLFPHTVDTYSISPCNRFLLAGLSDGSMQFVSLTKKTVVTGHSLATPPTHGPTFVASTFSGESSSAQMSLVTASGSVFVFTSVQLDRLHTAIQTGDLASLKDAQGEIQKRVVELQWDVVAAQAVPQWGDTLGILVATYSGLVRPGQETGDSQDIMDSHMLGGDTAVKIVQSKANIHNLFVLDSNEKLHVVCPVTMVRCYTWSQTGVQDFVLLEDEGCQDTKLLVVLREKQTEEEQRTLLIVSYPAFNVCYRLVVSWFCRLVTAPLSQDSPLFLEGAGDDVLRPGQVTRLRLRGISEGVPEARLARLLKRGKFEEATQFAGTFSLSVEPVYRAQSQSLLTRLSPWRKEGGDQDTETVLTQLECCLSNMQCLDYVVECCVTAALPSLAATRRILLFARSTIEKNLSSVSEGLMLRVSRTLHRLETFSLLEGGGVEQWMDFCRADMLGLVEQALSQGAMDRSLLLWTRHLAEFQSDLDLDLVEELLDCIPESQDCSSLLSWLRQFVPDLLELEPRALPLLATWAANTTRRLELTKRREWPEIGLNFAEAVLETFSFSREEDRGGDCSAYMTLLTLNQQRAQPDSPLSLFIHMINSLKDLLVLHRKFRIKLKLAEFLDPIKFNVVSMILDWTTSSQEVAPLLDSFLILYILRWNLQLDTCLSEYIKNILYNTDFTWHWHIGAAPWEEKVCALLQYISSVEEKSEVILEAVKNAPVPWSSTVTEMCALGQQLHHSNAVLIREQSSLVSVKTILRKYECKSYSTSGREAERLLQFLMKKGGEEGYEDAKAVSHVIGGKTEQELQEMYLEHLVREEGDSRAAIKFLHGVINSDPGLGVKLSKHIVDTAALVLRMEIGKGEEYYIDVVKAVSGMIKGDRDVTEVVRKAETLQRAWCLKSEFGLKVWETDTTGLSATLGNLEANKEMIVDFISDQIVKLKSRLGSGDVEGMKAMMKKSYFRLMRLCDLTLVTQEEGVSRLVLQLTKASLFQPALQVATMLRDSPVTTELAESLFTVIYRVSEELAVGGDQETGELVSLLSRLARQSLTYCSSSSLADTLELHSWQSLATKVHKESHSGKAFAQGTGSVDPYQDWRFSHFYQDKGLPLDKASVLPLVHRCLTWLLPCVEDPALPYLPRHTAATVNIQDLDVTAPDLETVGNAVDAKETCLGLTSSGQELVQSLQMAGHVMLGFEVLQRIEAPINNLLLGTDPELTASTQNSQAASRSHLVSQVVSRILAEPRCDLSLALGFISSESKRTSSLNLLAKINAGMGADFRKVSSLALVGVEHCRMHGLAKQADQFCDLYVRACWGRAVQDMNINFKTAFNGSIKERILVLKEMVKMPDVDIPMLKLYTKAFNIDDNEALTLYSEGLINKLVSRIDERNEVFIDNFKEISEKIDAALCLIDSDDILFDHLQKMFVCVCPYNYSVLHYILSKIHRTSTYRDNPPSLLAKADRVLGFLMQYHRVADPEPEYEIDPWMKDRSNPFPWTLAKLRLPLISLCTLSSKEKYKLLEKEFRMETYQAWMTVAKVLGMGIDNILYFAVKNTVTSMMEQHKDRSGINDSEAWMLGHVNKSVLEKIQTCIRSMTDPKKGAAASAWVLNRLPRGSDKVLASIGAEATVRGWCESGEGGKEAEDGLEHATKTRKQLETEQVLHKHRLALPEYLELVQQNKPFQLINKLFEDPSIEERNQVAAGEYPDIATAAQLIATINELNLVKMKYELLDKWLPLASSSSSADDTLADFNLDLGCQATPEASNSTDEANLLRCVYVLQAGFQDGLQYLLKYAFSTDCMVTTSHKLRALKCMFSICSEDELEEATGQSLTVLRDMLRRLVYLARLEGLGLPYSQDSLTEASISQLVEGVWRSCRLSADGVTLVRDLCAEYGVWTGQLWSALLEQMIKFSMVSELRSTLRLLNRQPHLWNCPQFLKAWNLVLMAPLATLVPPVSPEVVTQCQSDLQLVKFCPTAADLELTTLASECLRLGLGHLASGFLPYLSVGGKEPGQQEVWTKVREEKMKWEKQETVHEKQCRVQGKVKIKSESRSVCSPAL